MNRLIVAAASLSCLVALTTAASAYDGDWKRGRVYYQGVCTPCHKATSQVRRASRPTPIRSPNGTPICRPTSTRAARIRSSNTCRRPIAARSRRRTRWPTRFQPVSDQDLLHDVKAFVVNGAKDGDAPAGCN